MAKRVETLEQQFRKMDKKISRRKWRFRLATMLFVFFSFFMTIVLSIARDNAKDKKVKEYLEAMDSETLYTLYDNIGTRGNIVALAWYEQNLLGISNNIALAGISWSCEANKCNRNIIGDVVALCDDKSGALKVIVSEKTAYVGKNIVGEIIATKDIVYFVDKTDEKSIHSYNIGTGEEKRLINDSVCQFALYGNYIFYLNDAEKIMRYSLETEEVNEVVDNVQRFYLAGGLIVQNGTDIVCVELDGTSHITLVSNALLVGADSEYVYYTDFGMVAYDINTETVGEGSENKNRKNTLTTMEENIVDKEVGGKYILYAIALSTKEKRVIDESNDFIRAVYVTEEGILVDTVAGGNRG